MCLFAVSKQIACVSECLSLEGGRLRSLLRFQKVTFIDCSYASCTHGEELRSPEVPTRDVCCRRPRRELSALQDRVQSMLGTLLSSVQAWSPTVHMMPAQRSHVQHSAQPVMTAVGARGIHTVQQQPAAPGQLGSDALGFNQEMPVCPRNGYGPCHCNDRQKK